MRKAGLALCLVLIVISLVAVSGCARSGGIINLYKMLMNGASWTYEGIAGDLMVIGEDGSFRLVSGEQVTNGGYEVEGDQLELIFVDSEGNEIGTEEWSIEGDINGEETVITDLQGQKFYLSGGGNTLREIADPESLK